MLPNLGDSLPFMPIRRLTLNYHVRQGNTGGEGVFLGFSHTSHLKGVILAHHNFCVSLYLCLHRRRTTKLGVVTYTWERGLVFMRSATSSISRRRGASRLSRLQFWGFPHLCVDYIWFDCIRTNSASPNLFHDVVAH